jgi:hypothetical protein
MERRLDLTQIYSTNLSRVCESVGPRQVIESECAQRLFVEYLHEALIICTQSFSLELLEHGHVSLECTQNSLLNREQDAFQILALHQHREINHA